MYYSTVSYSKEKRHINIYYYQVSSKYSALYHYYIYSGSCLQESMKPMLENLEEIKLSYSYVPHHQPHLSVLPRI